MTAAARRTVRAATIRAAILAGPGEVRVGSAPVPEPAPHEVLIRVQGCGVCGSNVPVWTGAAQTSYPRAPGEPGHEAWGVVTATGRDVEGVEPGQRVVALSYRAFAQYDVADAATGVALPPDLEGQPVPGEALGCAMNVFARSGVEAGQRVAVVGIGFLGALLVQLCACAGAEVVALSHRPFSLEIAERMGARAAASAADAGEPFDVVLEAAGTQSTLDVAGALVRVRGRLVVAGYHQGGSRTVDMQSWNWRGIDVVNAHERDPQAYVRGMRDAVDALVSGRLDPSPLYTHRFPLERVADALDAARDRPDGFVKAMVEP